MTKESRLKVSRSVKLLWRNPNYSKQHYKTKWNRKGDYRDIHYWLKWKYGPASKCENIRCSGKIRNYAWCLVKGGKYDYKKSNFKQLCKSCHVKYDMTKNWRKRVGDGHRGLKYNKLITMSKNKIVAVNKNNGSKYVKCVCKNGLCRVATRKSKSTWLISRKSVSLVK